MGIELLTIVLIAFLAGLGIGSAMIALKLKRSEQQNAMLPGSGLMYVRRKGTFWAEWWHGLSTEMAGAIVTLVLFTLILGGAEQQRVIDERKAQLIMQMSSPDNGFATEAVRQLEAFGWLFDGTLQAADFEGADLHDINFIRYSFRTSEAWGAAGNPGVICTSLGSDQVCLEASRIRKPDMNGANFALSNLQDAVLWYAQLENASFFSADLRNADLSNANLRGSTFLAANLQGSVLEQANLQGSDLSYADLQQTNLTFTDLQGVGLTEADLRGANLHFANLQRADLESTDLRGADLSLASLQGSFLSETLFDERTVLPDAERTDGQYTSISYWTPETDMARYTDPNHPNFWQPYWLIEPQENSEE